VLVKIGRLFFLIPCLLIAGQLNFTASVDNTKVGVNEPVILRVTVEGENIGKVPSPKLPDLPDFDMGATSSSQSTNIQFINGKMTQQQTISFIYTLYPKQIGEFTINACKLEFKGEIYQTQPIKVTIVKGSTKSPGKTPATAPPPSEPGVDIEDNMKLLASTDRKNVYVGEQVTVEFTFYNRFNISDLNFAEMPSFSGFWTEPIFDAKRLNFQRKSVKGKLYNVALLKKSALFPMTSGRLQITPMKMDVSVVQAPRDFFDFFGTTKTVRIQSDPIYINVKPLPTEGKPEEFTGGVGRFTISASLDRNTSEAAEPINLIVKISGTGNIKLIEKPAIPSIPGVKILDPEVRDNISFSGNSVLGYKEFRYPLIPQIDGKHVVPRINTAYFDTHNKKYKTIETEELDFIASQTAAAKETAQTQGIEVLGSDIQYIKPAATCLSNQSYSARWWLVIFYALSLIIIGLSVFYRKHQARLLTDRAYVRKLRASKFVKKRLRAAENYLKKNDKENFFAALSRVLLGYIGDRFNLDIGALTSEQLLQELEEKQVDSNLLQKITELLKQCDMFRFSPGSECGEMNTYLSRVKEILQKL
jgi:hypothetical protein